MIVVLLSKYHTGFIRQSPTAPYTVILKFWLVMTCSFLVDRYDQDFFIMVYELNVVSST